MYIRARVGRDSQVRLPAGVPNVRFTTGFEGPSRGRSAELHDLAPPQLSAPEHQDGWFDDKMPEHSDEEAVDISGMPSRQDVDALRSSGGESGRRLFLTLMEKHHRGAVVMADEALGRAVDPRLRTFAHSVRHAQAGQLQWMRALAAGDSSRLPRRPALFD